MKWYKSTPVKAVLLVMEHIFAVVVVMALVAVWAFPSIVTQTGKTVKNYEDTRQFAYDMQSVSHDIIEACNVVEWPEMIDVMKYQESAEITGQNKTGLTFYKKDLLEIREQDTDGEIWVRKRADGTYVYQTWMQYRNDESEYENEWITYETVPRTLQTVDGKTLLEIVNTDSRWNGRFNDVQNAIRNMAYVMRDTEESYQTVRENYAEGNTNLSYLYVDYGTKKLFSNKAAYTDIRQVEQYVEELKGIGKYIVATDKLADFETNTQAQSDGITNSYGEKYLLAIAIDTSYPIPDIIHYKAESFKTIIPVVKGLLWPGIVAVLGFVIGFIWLSFVAGRSDKSEDIELLWVDRVPVEIVTVAGIAGVVSGVLLFAENESIYSVNSIVHISELVGNLALAAIATLIICATCFVVYLSFVRRLKARVFWKNMIIGCVWNWCRKGVVRVKSLTREFQKHQKCIVKVLLAVGAYVVLNWIVRAGINNWYWEIFVLIGLVIDVIVAYYVVRWALSKDKLEKGVKQISDGDIKYQIPTEGLNNDDIRIAEYINHMGDGFQKAVEQSMKDERLKTELLTNVSHDIKTPLTSIINYIDLLKRENIQDEKIQGYITVLEQKAARLKQLTEDVTEASKISSGNISIEYQNLDFVQMIQQTTGEFAERFEKKKLSVVLDMPNPPVVIWADGRRMWRIIENLYNNVAKYAMPGTRVYASLNVENDLARFSLKNISEQPLNISAEELTERFIRGDVSRSTEGSGLGLSIAKELTKLQGGEFELYLDGDLFKVTVEFPCK